MTDQEIVRMYIPFVDFLSTIMGDSVEIVLQDLSDQEHSVIAIKNGHLSGRSIGSPITDFGFNVVHYKTYDAYDYTANYQGKAKDRRFLSSTYFIKNQSGGIVGMLCINRDISPAENFYKAMDNFLASVNLAGCSSAPYNPCCDSVLENLDLPIDSIATNIVKKTLNSYSVTADRLTRDEKKHIVWELDEQGVSRIKGGVSEIAKVLQLSESTIYRYLNQRHDEDN